MTDHARAGELPERFREGVDPQADVEVTVTILERPKTETTSSEPNVPKYLKYWGVAAQRDTSIEEAITRVRELRDEWD